MNYNQQNNLFQRFRRMGADVVYADTASLMIRGNRPPVNQYRQDYIDHEHFIDVEISYADDLMTWFVPVQPKCNPPSSMELIRSD